MNPKVLLIDFIPKEKKETPSSIRNQNYVEDLMSGRDLGEVVICNDNTYPELLISQDPFIVITTSDYVADEIKRLKPDTLVYSTISVTSVFSRKTETEEKIIKQKKVFDEIEIIVKQIKESTEEERSGIRKFASVSYDDLYKMIQKAMISDDEDLKKKAWDLLFGEGERHSNFIWMRVQVMAEVWEHADWETRERLMCMSMERHIEQGTARTMDNFTDEDGLEYYQYMFLDPFGNDTNHIRRLPFATKGQDRYGYENLLEKNEIPTNYLRIQVEANSLRKQYDDYLAGECIKVKRVLEEWQKDSTRSKEELGVVPWNKEDNIDNPLTEKEVESLRNFLQKNNLNILNSVSKN